MPSTPPRKSLRTTPSAVTNDTPSKVKQVVSSPAVFGHVEHGRRALIPDIGDSIPEVPIQWFKDNILPPLPKGLNLNRLIRKLRSNGHIDKNRWSAFPKDPEKLKKVEDIVYAPFADVATLIGQTAATLLPNAEQVVAFECNPHVTPISNLRQNRSRPDGYGVYKSHTNYQPRGENHEIFWEFIVAPGEKKKNNSNADINDNVEKILWSFSHIMRDDPSRRFVVGYTIENADMRLWFCSRTDIIVTQPFNFIRGHKTLAHFLLSQMYAKSHELGYDTTMNTPTDTQLRAKNQWDITVHPNVHGEGEEGAEATPGGKKTRAPDVTFRTTELISSIGAEGVRSRGTRVWQAQQLVAGEMQSGDLVMKDYWVDSNRIREADIRLQILKDAPTDEDRDLLTQHLLTPLYSGDVMIDGEVDSTRTLRRSALLSACEGMTMVPLIRSSPARIDHNTVMEDMPNAPRGSGAIPQGPVPESRIVLLDDKSHHRIVFKERGITIEHLTKVSHVLRAGMQALKGLETMHKSGWVHRDISSGNILIVDGIIKIADLEYAKSMKDESSHSERSGTALFMSIEAGYHEYTFLDNNKEEDKIGETKDEAVDEGEHQREQKSGSDNPDKKAYFIPIFEDTVLRDARSSTSESAKSESPAKQCIFRYNPLHDIESLWWLLVYLLLYRAPVLKGDTAARIASQFLFYRPFFVPGESRLKAFILPSVFTSHGDCLHKALRPISDALNQIRILLVNRYIEVEQGDLSKIDHTVAADLVPVFMDTLAELEKKYTKGDIGLSPIRSARPQRDVEPPAAAATATGASLDSRQLLNPRKRSPTSDPDRPKNAKDTASDVAEEKKTKRAKRDKKASSSDESASPTRRGGGVSRPQSLGRTRSSGSSGDDVPLRRSQRNVKPVKR